MKNNKEKNTNHIVALLYGLSAICFYIAAIISFISKDRSGVMYLCLGSSFLCLQAVYLNKSNELKGKNRDEKKK